MFSARLDDYAAMLAGSSVVNFLRRSDTDPCQCVRGGHSRATAQNSGARRGSGSPAHRRPRRSPGARPATHDR